MKRDVFRRYLAQSLTLTAKQRRHLVSTLQKDFEDTLLPTSVQQRERQLDQERTCIYCGSQGTVRNGKTAGLIRFRCRNESCSKTYTAVSKTPLTHLRCRHKWELYQTCLQKRMTLQQSAEYCEINYRTAFLWRHRMIAATRQSQPL